MQEFIGVIAFEMLIEWAVEQSHSFVGKRSSPDNFVYILENDRRWQNSFSNLHSMDYSGIVWVLTATHLVL